MKKLLMISLFLLAGCGAWVDEADAINGVENMGFTNVKIISKHIFAPNWNGCGSDDDVAFKVRATNPTGKRVNLIVCAGWPFKGVTVRSQ